MATTLQTPVLLTSAQLVGTTMQAAGAVAYFNVDNALEIAAGGAGTILSTDQATDGLAKHGASTLALSGTTAKTIDLTDLTSVVAAYAGDTTFATVTRLKIVNAGAGSITIAPGASNPFSVGLGGTTPTFTLDAGATVILGFAAKVVDSTHKTILLTPAATTTLYITVSGA